MHPSQPSRRSHLTCLCLISLVLTGCGGVTRPSGLVPQGAWGGDHVGLVLDAARGIQISSDGSVSQEGNPIGQLELADFTSMAGLSKQGANYFRRSI